MSPFWAGLFENLQGRGRNAGLFLVVLPTLLIAAVILARMPEDVFLHYALPGLAGLILLGTLLLLREWMHARARAKERVARRELSADELRKARMKLVRQQAPLPPKNSLVTPG
ncbi:MAG: hypothetical protein RLY20_195 [Verrucomicrobiota bacterium]|jgi:4-amino-4-deoxy-L-arabinose transferase-like glycosyltransferase